MQRAIRRHYTALIKKLIQREVAEINERYSEGYWSSKNPATQESRRQSAIRHAYRNDGRYVRTKEARGGNGYICDCSWCLANWLRATTREIARITDEEKDYLPGGYFVDDSTYFGWGDPYDWYDDCFLCEDSEEYWWEEYQEAHGMGRRSRARRWFDERRDDNRMRFEIGEVVDFSSKCVYNEV